jgi:hypothetical protein
MKTPMMILLGVAFWCLALLPISARAENAPDDRVVRITFVGDVCLDGGPGHVVTNGDDILCFGSGNRYRVNRVWSLVETIFDVRNPDLERNSQCPQCILTPWRPRR